jgi:hypothetical protein
MTPKSEDLLIRAHQSPALFVARAFVTPNDEDEASYGFVAVPAAS